MKTLTAVFPPLLMMGWWANAPLPHPVSREMESSCPAQRVWGF